MISLFANCFTEKKQLSKKKEEKNTMNAQRLMSRVRENADLLKLLLDLAFLFCGLLKQVNTAVECKTIGAIFAHFSVSVILFSGWPKILHSRRIH